MNLDEQLRAALNLEAQMRTVPPPDVEGMISGGQTRRRRRNAGAASGLLAVAIVGAGIFGVTQLGGEPQSEPPVASEPSEPAEAAPLRWPEGAGTVAPGTHRFLVGYGAEGDAIEADVTTDGTNWEGSNYPVAFTPRGFAGLGVYQPAGVAGGCRMDAGFESAATEVQPLVQQLVGMPRSEVLEAPERTNAFGGSATHLRLRIDAFCGGRAAYLVAEGPAGGRGISYFDEAPKGDSGDVIIDFWVLDVDGVAVIVDKMHTVDAPDDLVAQATRAADSVSFVPAE